MSSAKRSRERITSGNWRPSKTLRFGQESRSTGNEDEPNGDLDDDMEVERETTFQAESSYESYYNNNTIQVPRMRVAQVVVWPNSLAAIKTQFFYNLTPQEGPFLPEHINQLVTSRIRRTFSRDSVDYVPPNIPYLHLGFSPFLELQAFVFLPNLRLSVCYGENPGRIYEFMLERWTNDVFLPAIRQKDVRVPTSWRSVKENKYSPEWYYEGIAPYPAYELRNESNSHSFDAIWRRVQQLSMKVPEFQHSFLLLYSNGQSPQLFHNNSPEEFLQSFEASWHRNIDMTHIVSPEENLKVDFDYTNSNEIRNLVMR